MGGQRGVGERDKGRDRRQDGVGWKEEEVKASKQSFESVRTQAWA